MLNPNNSLQKIRHSKKNEQKKKFTLNDVNNNEDDDDDGNITTTTNNNSNVLGYNNNNNNYIRNLSENFSAQIFFFCCRDSPGKKNCTGQPRQ